MFLATALLLPGVLHGNASTYHLPREDFFRACGRNLWRFIRLMIMAGIVFLIVAGALFGIQGVLEKRRLRRARTVLGFEVRVVSLVVIFLVMTELGIWFDLAETDIVLSDQRAVQNPSPPVSGIWRNLALASRKLCGGHECGGGSF